MTQVYENAKALEKGTVYSKEAWSAAQWIVDKTLVLYEQRLTVEAMRVKRLNKLKNIFAIVAALFLILFVGSIAGNVPYEPALALFFCTFGTFAVFAMKVRDARR